MAQLRNTSRMLRGLTPAGALKEGDAHRWESPRPLTGTEQANALADAINMQTWFPTKQTVKRAQPL